MKKYEIEENFVGEKFENLEEALLRLRKICDDETHYNYSSNRKNTYTLYENIYDEDDEIISSDIILSINIGDYYEMDFEQKEALFDVTNN